VGLLIAAAQGGGFLAAQLRQPRVVGEILGGLVLGPTVLGAIAPEWSSWIVSGRAVTPTVLGAAYQMGILFLMFASGAEMRRAYQPGERRVAITVTIIGTLLPFAAGLLALRWVDAARFMGSAQSTTAFVLTFGSAMAVTSIPVISRIMFDLKILDTSFSRIVLSSAVLEDLILWAVLAVVLGLVGSSHESSVGLPVLLGVARSPVQSAVYHLAIALALFGGGIVFGPHAFAWVTRSRWNIIHRSSPVAFRLVVMLTLSAVSLLIGVAPLFGAFIAGIITAPTDADGEQAHAAIRQVSFASLVPLYFAIVGLRLDLTRGFEVVLFLGLLAWASIAKAGSVYAGARLAGESSNGARNLAVALNCRGGPGIVLASVTFDAGIINAGFYAMLVLLALVTSIAAGSWLETVVRRGGSLR